MTEFEFIRHFLQNKAHSNSAQVVLGIGDDAAIWAPGAGSQLCLSADLSLAGRHFFAQELPENIAYKIVAVNVSDMAAMGAVPRFMLLSAALPKLDTVWLSRFSRALFWAAKTFDVALIGGDTTKGVMAFNITIGGEVPASSALCRLGAKVGDDIWVSGNIGLSALALQCRLGQIHLPREIFSLCNQRLVRPVPRVNLGVALRNIATSALDVSDGLAQDVSHLARASKVQACLFEANIPTLQAASKHVPPEILRSAILVGGDDYELAFTAPKALRNKVLEIANEVKTPLARIGYMKAGRGVIVLDHQERPVVLTKAGYEHFSC